jgi:hypothetical protein
MVVEGETAKLDDSVLDATGALRIELDVERDRAAGQTVELSLMKAGARGAPHRLTVQVGEAGDARVSDLEPGRYDVVARLSALGYARADAIDVAAGATALARLAFTERLVLEGRIRRPDGTPAAHAAVDVYLAAGGQATYALPGRAPDNFTGNRAITDDSGRFRIAGLDPGASDLRVTLDGEAPLEQRIVVGPHMSPLTLDLERSASCEIDLVDAADQPLADKVVLAQTTGSPHHAASAVTDRNGRVRFERFPPGRYLVRAVSDGEPRGTLVLAAGQAGRLVLKGNPR